MNQELWKENIRKTNRAQGFPYMAKNGTGRPGRTIGRDCMCKATCFAKVDGDQKQVILDAFNQLADKSLQDMYLQGLIKCKTAKRRRPRTNEGRPKLYSFKYNIRIGVLLINFCKVG